MFLPESSSPSERGAKGQITELLDAVREGQLGAEDALLAKVQDRLRCLARKMLSSSPVVARWEQTDDVFNELWIQLRPVLLAEPIRDHRHFFRLANLRMNRLLCDLARHYRGPENFAAHYATGLSATAAEMIAKTPEGRQDLPRNKSEDPVRRLKPTPSQFMGNPQPGPVTAVTLKEDHMLVHEVLNKLPEEDIELIGLIYYQELTQKEAAEILQVNERTVRRRVVRAYRCMGQLLNDPRRPTP